MGTKGPPQLGRCHRTAPAVGDEVAVVAAGIADGSGRETVHGHARNTNIAADSVIRCRPGIILIRIILRNAAIDPLARIEAVSLQSRHHNSGPPMQNLGIVVATRITDRIARQPVHYGALNPNRTADGVENPRVHGHIVEEHVIAADILPFKPFKQFGAEVMTVAGLVVRHIAIYRTTVNPQGKQFAGVVKVEFEMGPGVQGHHAIDEIRPTTAGTDIDITAARFEVNPRNAPTGGIPGRPANAAARCDVNIELGHPDVRLIGPGEAELLFVPGI